MLRRRRRTVALPPGSTVADAGSKEVHRLTPRRYDRPRGTVRGRRAAFAARTGTLAPAPRAGRARPGRTAPRPGGVRVPRAAPAGNRAALEQVPEDVSVDRLPDEG
ncbi:hypothetical protein GCM10010302_42760 [Streptomyces polychromogenes]|uniref:Uncharacterized protein n=1 Tax=Streptomyces polychromogenes TaxID=67342 RepID=A0ABN0VGK7_9ACTN